LFPHILLLALLCLSSGLAKPHHHHLSHAHKHKAKHGIETWWQKLHLSSTNVNCTNPAAIGMCPLENVPKVNFTGPSGRANSSVPACCPGTFAQCHIGEQVCRDVLYYTIDPSEGQHVEVCPATTPDCTCQQQLSVQTNLLLLLCPFQKPCCSTCQCYGDPHCVSFQNQDQVWVVCDDRDSSCNQEKSLCLANTYGGKSCLWNSNGNYCYRNSNTPTPEMIMYQKIYRNYWNAKDTQNYEFKMTLTLGVLGAISKVTIQDAGKTYTFGFNSNKKCTTPSEYKMKNNIVTINNLPSDVYIQMECYAGKGTNQRWDIQILRDPWYVYPHPSDEVFLGFCPTGNITEANGQLGYGQCVNADNALSGYLACNAGTCNSKFCSLYAPVLQFGSQPQTQSEVIASCNNFVETTNNGLLMGVCSIALANGQYPVDPSKCMSQSLCAECVAEVEDYPANINNTLDALRALAKQGLPVASSCENLLQVGLQRKFLVTQSSGIQIDFQAPGTNTWRPVFALFNSEIEQCVGCLGLAVNGTVPANQALLQVGTYRVQQCQAPYEDGQDLCQAVPQYNISVVYENPTDGIVASYPFGSLWNQGDIVCSPTKYPNCPTNYVCCIWDPVGQSIVWNQCMIANYGPNWATQYSQCGK